MYPRAKAMNKQTDFLIISLYPYYNVLVISDHLFKENINHSIFESENNVLICLPINENRKQIPSFKVLTAFCYKFGMVSFKRWFLLPNHVKTKVPFKYWRIVDDRDVSEIELTSLQKVVEVTEKENINVSYFLELYEFRKQMLIKSIKQVSKLKPQDKQKFHGTKGDLFDQEVFIEVFKEELSDPKKNFNSLFDGLMLLNATKEDGLQIFKDIELTPTQLNKIKERLC
jgi:hypothetical protein